MKLSLLGYYVLGSFVMTATEGYIRGREKRQALEGVKDYMFFPDAHQNLMFEAVAIGDISSFFQIYRLQRPYAPVEEIYGAVNDIKAKLEGVR